MRIESKRLDLHNKFIHEYEQQNTSLLDHFDYNPYENNVFKKRVSDLKEQNFNRDALADVLYKLNLKWNACKSTFKNIESLRDQNSVVVIGGQQAGVLSGPLYTVNKIISIISLAKQQQEELGVPVLPVFWIAGEDHDYDEVNHIYLQDVSELKKHSLRDEFAERVSVSNRSLDTSVITEWVQSIFGTLKETAYTKELITNVERHMHEAETFTDFFALFIHQIFKDTGLILIDSGNRHVRQLESMHFEEMIRKQERINEDVYKSLQSVRTKGYHVSVDVKEKDGNLFIEENGERILLQKEENKWVGKNNECQYTYEELLVVAKETPERLSNNVVTRPLMQEKLFPTLAFFAGPSEAAYWSILKEAFHHLEMKMPPVLPRVSITFIDQKVSKLVNKYSISIEQVINKGVYSYKQNWLNAQSHTPVEEMADQFKALIEQGHSPMKEITNHLTSDISQFADKNLELIFAHVDQLTSRINHELSQKYDIHLKEFDYVQMHVKPFGGLQERVWNIIYFLNHYGDDWLKELNEYSFDWKKQHYIAYL
ncbi:bacillithiol biosynthesis cysteine-adding enzyme BshC [Gracilibacillus kekensis]|uniref:Putative cysteine ligase BshC n=1 Tax=Gracilibacillus kekensis TaxID=1027249 RepID=A0A1M7PDF1_9BACI|nr:bacillithiol biosynthesis cysteine-adding enzyme BshC [Gracilibacillus kekensis]SHN14932.1 bacillithiol biosynthesis cysteine-adding enzyme BshC [Gracilibacillus kekensis]